MKPETIQLYSLAFTWNTAQLNTSHLHPFRNNHSSCMTIMPDYSSQALPFLSLSLTSSPLI